jgi:ABC-type proline/glycine betaine transport system permease subunit
MTSTELGGIVRTIAAAGFGILVGKGFIDAETAAALAGAVGTIAIAVWSVLAKRKA